ncbi:MAG: ATP-binding cassette domain-containing protein [Roseovarius sp.]
MITLENIAVVRDGDTIVKAGHIECEPGQCSVIVGPSGGGKTSLLMAIGGVGRELGLQVNGRVVMDDGRVFDLSDMPTPICSLVQQNAALYDELSAQENLDIVMATHATEPKIDPEVMQRLLDGIDGDAMPNALSGGQRQRVAIVRSLLSGARICVMDEPNAGLDPRRSQDLSDLIASLCANGIHVIVTTHHPKLFVDQAATFYFLANGRLSEVPKREGSIDGELERLARETVAPASVSKPVSLRATARTNWFWEFFLRDLWSHFLSPATLLYIATACALIAFTLGYVSVVRYPFSALLLDATIERIAAGLGDGFYRFTIPLIVGILIAARSGSLATTDLLQKQLNGSTLALAQIQVPIRRYRSIGLLAAISFSSAFLYLFAIVVSLYTLGLSISLTTQMHPEVVMAFVVEDIFNNDLQPVKWGWILAKMLLSGACVSMICILVGRRNVRSGQQIRDLGAFAVLLSVLTVIAIQTALILVELA